jgi:hypothetical protein
MGNIIKHFLLLALGIFGIWSFFSQLDWIFVESRKASMVKVRPIVADKWRERKSGERIDGEGLVLTYTYNLLQLENTEVCPCFGIARVPDHLYNKTVIDTELDGFCHDGKCYLLEDIRWEEDHKLIICIYGLAGALFLLIEAFLLIRFLRRYLNSPA